MALPNVFSPGQIFTAANANLLRSNQYNQTVTTKTASYTPTTTTDIGTRVIMNSASATTITINTSIYTAGDTFFIGNIGVGVCTLTAGTCTITSAGPLAIPQNGGGTLYFSSASAAIFYPSAGPAATSALTFIAGSALTSTATSINNCFSATYLNYKVVVNEAVTDGSRIRLRWRVGGSDNTTSNYNYSNFGQTLATGAYADNSPGQAVGFHAWTTGADAAHGMSFSFDVFSPFATAGTHIGPSGPFQGNNLIAVINMGVFTATTSFDGFTLFPSAGNLTGLVKIYGYSNS